MKPQTLRTLAVRWMYVVVAAQFLAGAALPWIADTPVFEAYHHGIETAFWGAIAPAAARAQQVWWISLFGATVQGLSIWMLALVCIGDRQRSAVAWAWLIAGLLVWAPQDIFISLRIACWPHVWIDALTLVAMLPALAWLWGHDRRCGGVSSRGPAARDGATSASAS